LFQIEPLGLFFSVDYSFATANISNPLFRRRAAGPGKTQMDFSGFTDYTDFKIIRQDSPLNEMLCFSYFSQTFQNHLDAPQNQ